MAQSSSAQPALKAEVHEYPKVWADNPPGERPRADLLLAGKVIARGEVVAVDGNYGLRVLELVAPR